MWLRHSSSSWKYMPVREVWSHHSTVPVMPKAQRADSRIWWFRVSKKQDRTSTIRTELQQWSPYSGCCEVGCSVGEKQRADQTKLFFLTEKELICRIELCFVISGVTWACLNVLGKYIYTARERYLCESARVALMVRSAVVCGSGSGLRDRMLGGLHRELWRPRSPWGERRKRRVECCTENWLLKVANLSVKKLTKSSAVREEVGGRWMGTE